MSQGVPDRRPVLAMGSELGPVVGHRPVILDEASLRLDVYRHRCDRLGHGEGGEDRILVHLPTGGLVHQPSSDVDGQLAVEVRGDLESDLTALVYRPLDGLLDKLVRALYARHVSYRDLSPFRPAAPDLPARLLGHGFLREVGPDDALVGLAGPGEPRFDQYVLQGIVPILT